MFLRIMLHDSFFGSLRKGRSQSLYLLNSTVSPLNLSSSSKISYFTRCSFLPEPWTTEVRECFFVFERLIWWSSSISESKPAGGALEKRPFRSNWDMCLRDWPSERSRDELLGGAIEDLWWIWGRLRVGCLWEPPEFVEATLLVESWNLGWSAAADSTKPSWLGLLVHQVNYCYPSGLVCAMRGVAKVCWMGSIAGLIGTIRVLHPLQCLFTCFDRPSCSSEAKETPFFCLRRDVWVSFLANYWPKEEGVD